MEDNKYLYKIIIWTGILIPNRKAIKFISIDGIDEIRNKIAAMLDGNALCITNNKGIIRCIDRTNIRDITIKQIKKL